MATPSKNNNYGLTVDDIDNILDEVELEQNQSETKQTDNDLNVNWNEILREMRKGNTAFIKNIITSNDISINAQNPLNGRTLLIYSVIIGNTDLIKAICNFGADVHIKDNEDLDALDYALKFGQYKISELIFYQQLSGSLGNDLKNIASQIHEKNKEAELMKTFKIRTEGGMGSGSNIYLARTLTEYMVGIIEERAVFGADMLYYAWYLTTNQLQSQLWKTMMQTFEDILSNTSDRKGWNWLKQYFINSLIWYLPHPRNTAKNEAIEEDTNDMEFILSKTLFYELLKRVRAESKKQSDLLLKEKIRKIKTERSDDWNALISYNVHTKYSKNARQDACGCILSKYTEYELSEERYPPSTHFSAKKHYDKYIYLNELIFRANILDSIFQNDMKLITEQIGLEIEADIIYRAGPVKTLKRSQNKVDNDYIKEDYPTSAKILDINRCALQFNTIIDLMKFIQIFTNKIEKKQARCVTKIIRCKNGWSLYDSSYPQYTDIKLNALISSPDDGTCTIVAEIQFLLNLMSAFKKKAHKLYSIERKFELVYNWGKLSDDMSNFKDNVGINGVIMDLAKNDDLKYFTLLWNISTPHYNTLIGGEESRLGTNVWDTALMSIIFYNGEINAYLKENSVHLYYKTIRKYIQTYCKQHSKYGFSRGGIAEDKSGHKLFIESLASKADDTHTNDWIIENFVEQLADIIRKDSMIKNKAKALFEILSFTDVTSRAFITVLCELDTKYNKSVRLILNSNIITGKQKIQLAKLSFEKAIKSKFVDQAIQIVDYFKNDAYFLMKLIPLNHYPRSIDALCANADRSSHKFLQLILNNDTIRGKEKIFLNEATFTALASGFHDNIITVFNHFPSAKRALEWCKTGATESGSDAFIYHIITKCFSNDLNSLKQWLSDSLFYCICHLDENGVKSLKYVLDELSNDLGDKYIVDTLLKSRCIYRTSNEACFEILNYLKKDHGQLLRALNHEIGNDEIEDDESENDEIENDEIEKETLFGHICGKQDSEQYQKQGRMLFRYILEYILVENELNLTDDEKYALLTRAEGKSTCLHLAMRNHSIHGGSYQKNGYQDIIIDAFKDRADLLLNLLLHKTEEEKAWIVCCKSVKIMEDIFGIIHNDEIIKNKILSVYSITDFNGEEAQKFMKQYLDYLQLYELANGQEIEAIDIEAKYKTNPFITACYLDRNETIQNIMTKYVKNDNDKLMDLFIYQTDKNGVNALMKAKRDVILQILQRFKDDKHYLVKLLTAKDDTGKQIFDYLLESKQNSDVIQYILSLKILTDKFKVVKLLNNSWKVTKGDNSWDRYTYTVTTLHHAIDNGFVSQILIFFRNDRKQIIKYLINKDVRTTYMDTPLIAICKHETISFEELIFNNTVLSHNDKINMIFDANRFEDNVFRTISWNRYKKHNMQNGLEILNFLEKNDKPSLIKLLSQNVGSFSKADTCLMRAARYQNDDILLKAILQCINKMDGKMQLKILSMQYTESVISNNDKRKDDGGSFLFKLKKAQHLKTIFCMIENNKIVSQLLKQKNKNYQTLMDLTKQNITGWSSHYDPIDFNKWYEIEAIILKYEDYLEFDANVSLSFDDYDTNPFVTACEYGKTKTIFKLLNYMKENKDKHALESLLSEHNCFAILKENGFNAIVTEIVTFLDTNDTKLKY